MDKSLDSKFDSINGLAWYPWISTEYKGTVVLGESNYGGWGHDDWLESKDFTRNRIAGPALSGSADEPLYRNLERAIYGKSDISAAEQKSFWNSVAYMNIVQRPMKTIEERPVREDFKNGWDLFWKANQILKAHTVIVIGTEPAKVQTFRQALTQQGITEISEEWSKEKNGSSYEYSFQLNKSELKHVVFIKHTSQFFSWETCSRFLAKCEVNL